jgi:ABC-2 type transport system permease protein
MLATLKSEIRKVLSIRSTYVILLFAMAMEALFAFYVPGWQTQPDTFQDPGYLANQAVNAVSALGLFAGLVAMLLVTHEYRYNTIMYTLTSSKSRTQVILAKLATVVLFAAAFTLIFGAMSPLLTKLAIEIRGFELAQQTIHWWSLIWHTLVGGVGYVLIAFIVALIIRAQVGAIAALFLIPATVEPLLGLILKKNAIYLPFNAINGVLGTLPSELETISSNKSALVVVAYVVVGLAVAWALFLKRDAN